MRLLYLVFGPHASHHAQATFSILTFLRRRAALPRLRVHVLTDAPEWYAHLCEHVAVERLTPEQLREWRGEVDFFWRIKLKGLESLSQRFPDEPLLYLDADTFLYAPDPAPHLLKPLRAGRALMHENEGPLAQLRSKTERLMWRQVAGQTFGGVTIGPQHAMWNAGAVGIPAGRAAEALRLALAICDEMCRRDVTRRLIEQFALSVALAETAGLQPAAPAIGHYWSNKEQWQARIEAFLTSAHLRGLSLDEELAALEAFDCRATPVGRKVRNTERRLQALLTRLLPPRTRTLDE